jgi:hypothetical protein
MKKQLPVRVHMAKSSAIANVQRVEKYWTLLIQQYHQQLLVD